MSFSFRFTKSTKEEAAAGVDEVKAGSQGEYIPPCIVDAVKSAINALPDNAKRSISVSSYGHFDDQNGNAAITVSTVTKVQA